MRRRQRKQRYLATGAAALSLICTFAAGYQWLPDAAPRIAASPRAGSRRDVPQPLPVVDRRLAELAQKIDGELTQPTADAAVARFHREVSRLEQQPAIPSDIHLGLLHEVGRADGPEIAEIGAAIGRLQRPESRVPWTSVTTDPTAPTADEILQLRERIEDLRSRFGATP